MRIRKVETAKEFEKSVDEYITMGYELKSQGEANALLKKGGYGSIVVHIIIFIFTIWWTIGLGNLAYALYSNSKSDEILLKIEE
ncbi:MAG: hypothetical protein LBU74_03740 [Methanobacteriaceae archaeon]|nr:hypothetical protein [Candidatus Methanorudis spinitermitis]